MIFSKMILAEFELRNNQMKLPGKFSKGLGSYWFNRQCVKRVLS